MLLEQEGLWNDLTPELRNSIMERVSQYGKRVRYKFNISNPNPDPEKREGATLWPMMYTLVPKTFNIVDPYEKRSDKQRSKRIGLVTEVDETGKPRKFKSVQVFRKQAGIIELDLDKPDDVYMAMYLELHPKMKDGQFSDNTRVPIFERIDELKLAKEKNQLRSHKLKAMADAETMSDAEVVQFADAMTWNSAEPLEVLRSMIADMAEYDSAYYLEMRDESNKKIEYLSTVKRAVDKQIISFDATEYRYIWVSNQQTVAQLPPAGSTTEVEKMAEWLQHGGEKADAIFKKLKSSLK